MRTFIFAAIIGLTAAQSTAGLPSCATTCVGTSFGSCGSLDVKCICSDSSLIANLACCVSTACDAADQEATIEFADALCAGYDVSSLPSAATCASTASGNSTSNSTSTAAVAASGNSTVATTVAPSASSSLSSVLSSAASVVASKSSSAASKAASATSAAGTSSTAAATSASASTAGGSKIEAGLGFGALLAGVLAAF